MKPGVAHTLTIIRSLHADAPPLVPKEVIVSLGSGLDGLSDNHNIDRILAEDTLFPLVKPLWPYRETFRDFFLIFDAKLGETFFLGACDLDLKRRYRDYRDAGGTFGGLRQGQMFHLFSRDEREQLRDLMSRLARDLRAYVNQAVLSVERRRYEDKINKNTQILVEMNQELEKLYALADAEEERHFMLAGEIRAHARALEEGLCALGPKTHPQDVSEAYFHFLGRKQEKRMV